MKNSDELKYAFTPVGKLDPGSSMRLLKLQNAFIELGTEIIDLVPNCADRTSAIRKLLEAKFMCSQAVTHYVAPSPKVEKDAPKDT